MSFQSKQTSNEYIIHRNESSFPYFPEDDDETYYAQHMRKVLKIIESWMYTQGFYMRKYYIIPEDISVVNSNEIDGVTTPYFDLFANIAGRNIRRLIPKW